MINESMTALGKKRSVIREIFEYAKKRSGEIGAENVFDFSIGNPSVPAPEQVNEAILRIVQETPSVALHGYTSVWRGRARGRFIYDLWCGGKFDHFVARALQRRGRSRDYRALLSRV